MLIIGRGGLNTVFPLSPTSSGFHKPHIKTNSPRPGKDRAGDSSCDRYESGLSEAGQAPLLLSCLEPLNSAGQQTKLATTQGTWVRMFVQKKGSLPSLVHESYL